VAVFTSRHTTVVLKDGTGTPITATVGPGPGDLTISGFQEGFSEATPILNRGDFQELVLGADTPVEFSITIWHDGDLTGTSVLDAIQKSGNFASGVTVDPGGVVWALDCLVTMTRGGVTNTYLLNTCRLKADWKEGLDGNQFTISGTCYEGVTIT
jgi:hypothetical protein